VKNHESDTAVVLGQPCGPLSFHIPGFAASLASQGYTKTSIAYRFALVRAFDRWMQQRRIPLGHFNEERIEQFLHYRWRRYSKQPTDRPTLLSLLRQLWDIGAIERPITSPEISPVGNLQTDFAQYLAEQRGLRPATVKQYLFHSRRFLTERFGNGVLPLGALNTQDISRCLLRQARAVSPNAAQRMTVALRNLFRFLHQRGDIATNLADAVPATASWSLAGLPKSLSPQQVELVLKACKQDDPVALRNRAILVLLARLGLRANEIATLTLDDVDWRVDQLSVQAKGRQRAQLPLPCEVGSAVAAYLQNGRPRSDSRRLFLRDLAPHAGFASSCGISMVATTALKRAGIEGVAHKGSHLFRHSLATALLRSGASLTEIGQVLRHQDHDTTRIYAKVDIDSLRVLGIRWPGGVR